MPARSCCLVMIFLLLLYQATAQDTSAPQTKGVHVQASATAGQAVNGTTYALVVGISSYKKITRLNYADKDAIAFRDFLVSKAGGNVNPDNIRLYLNDSATGSTIYTIGILSWLNKKQLKKGDRIYIYLSGHGDANEGGVSFFLPSTSDPVDYVASGALAISFIKAFIKVAATKGAEVVFIFDACRTNEKGYPNGGIMVNEFVTSDKVTGEVLMLASSAGEPSLEDGHFGDGHGLFTYYLLLGLAGFADSDHDGKVSLFELETWVKQKVFEEAHKRNSKQRPYFWSDDQSDPVLAYVDNAYFNALAKANELHSNLMSGDQLIASRSNATSKSARIVSDSNVLALFNLFSGAIREKHLLGENSADFYYKKLQQEYTGSSLAEEARYLLANEFIDYAQQKINVHLNGKDISFVNNIKKRMPRDSVGQNPVTNEVKELERVIRVRFGDAAKMMEKAIELLQSDTAYVQTLQTKLWFLQARSYYDESDSSISYDKALRITRQAIKLNPTASYCYNLLGQLYRINTNKAIQDSSEIMFAKAIELTPGWLYPYRNMGNYYLNKMNYEKAADNYKKAIEADSTDAETYNELGILSFYVKRYEEAEFYYKKALAIDSLQKYAARNLGLLYSGKNQQALSEKYYLLSIQIDTNYAASYYDMADEFVLKGANAQAEKYYLKAIEKNPRNADYLNNLGAFYNNHDNDSLAIKYYLQAINVNPNYVLAYNNLGSLYRLKRNFPMAKKYYARAVQLDSTNANAWNGLGLVYYIADNKDDSAEYHFKKSLQMDSNSRYPWYNLGNLYNYEKKYALAEKHYLTATRIDSAYSYAYYMLAGLYKKLNEPDLARNNYLKALRFDSANYSILNDLGVLYDDQGNKTAAEKYYKLAIRQNPRFAVGYNNLGLLYKKSENYSQARVYYNKSLELDPVNADAYEGLGSIYYFQNNRDDSAVYYFKKSLQLDSLNKYPYYGLGNLYNRQQKYEQAEKYYRKAIQVDSTFAYAWYRLAGLYKKTVQLAAAEKYYFRALSLDSADANVLNDIGVLYHDARRYTLAEKYYKAAVHANAVFLSGYSNLGILYRDEARYDSASKYHKLALQLDTANSSLLNGLGLVYYYQDTLTEQAALYFEKAIRADSLNKYPYCNMGDLLVLQKKYPLARQYYRHAIHIDSAYSYVYYKMGDEFGTQGILDSAALYYKKALHFDSAYKAAWNALGLLYQQQKKYDSAEKAFLRALYFDSAYKYSCVNLGNNYKYLSDYALSLRYYQQAIRADTGYKYAYEQLGLLYLGELKDPENGRRVFEKLVARYPSDSNCNYNLACSYSRLGNMPKALFYVEAAIKGGWTDVEWMRKDTDLVELRKDPLFEALVKKYFPGK